MQPIKPSTPSLLNPIPFIDLAAQQKHIRGKIDAAIAKVLDSGHYVMGDEVGELEAELAKFSGAKYALSCASGTTALVLALMAIGAGKKDAIFVPSFTFIATAEAVLLVGATPFIVDVKEDDFLIDPEDLKRAIVKAKSEGFTPKAVIPVDLFGLPADYAKIEQIASENKMQVISDACQSFGAESKGKRAGTMGDIAATSFFPAKPLGCYGDGGAIFTDNDEYAALLKSYRVHGMGGNRYENIRIGVNGRLDTIQAAILLVKLSVLATELEQRDKVAARYRKGITAATHQVIPADAKSAWAQYSMLINKDKDRDILQGTLKEKGIPTMVYYPIPVHQQQAYTQYAFGRQFPISERLAKHIIALPMHPYLDEKTQDYIIAEVNEALA